MTLTANRRDRQRAASTGSLAAVDHLAGARAASDHARHVCQVLIETRAGVLTGIRRALSVSFRLRAWRKDLRGMALVIALSPSPGAAPTCSPPVRGGQKRLGATILALLQYSRCTPDRRRGTS